ncbi:hypothetical protein QLX67_11850, partial [Balneolaceae bacterium ANBcel3]|nr:hypothetical protein [Balneolaceae bacterium ANBcel3]
AALSAMGIPVCTHIDDYWIKKVDSWLNNPTYVQLSFPDPSENILDRIMDISKTTPAIKSPKKPLFKKKNTLRYLPGFQTH